jgi:hypothetical protein
MIDKPSAKERACKALCQCANSWVIIPNVAKEIRALPLEDE